MTEPALDQMLDLTVETVLEDTLALFDASPPRFAEDWPSVHSARFIGG